MTDIVFILTTVPYDERAELFARTLIEEGIAACANLHGPMTSVYRWKGSIESDRELQLVIKTTRDRVPAVEALLRELHTYELPEFLVIEVAEGSPAYLAWVREQTRSG